MNRATFDTVVNILGPRIVRENLRFRACLCPAKILAIGLYRLAHGSIDKKKAGVRNEIVMTLKGPNQPHLCLWVRREFG